MVIQELRKIFWKRKLLLALALVLLFEGMLAWRGADGIFSSTQDKRVYMDLLQSYAGDLTPEKRERLDQELETYENAQELMVQAEEQYQNGELTGEGFDARTAELAPYRANLAARSDFAEAARYAEAKPGRTLVNQLAWNELFDTDRVDFLLSVLLILFAILAFVSEDETDFRQIKQTTVHGKKAVYRIDAVLGVALAVLSVSLTSLFRWLAAGSLLNPGSMNAPLDSLKIFENSPFSNLSLAEGYLLATGLKAVGYTAFVCLCFLFGQWFRSALTVSLAGLLTVLLPPYMLKAPARYDCSPVSLMLSVGFLRGDVYVDLGGSGFWESRAAGKPALWISLAAAVILILLAFFTLGKREGKKR